MPNFSRQRSTVDLSHTIEDGMITYRGLPAPVICDYLTRERSRAVYAPGTEFQIGKIEMVANTGTYIDSPFHRFEDRRDISQMPLDDLVDLDCVVVRVTDVLDIGPEAFDGRDIKGKAVLIHTGWDANWRTDRYFESHPHLNENSARQLAERGATLVGIDSFNIDSTSTGARPVHSVLLGHDIPIVEHLCNLAALPDVGARFTAAPAPVRGMGSFPVRAFAIVKT